MTASTRAHIDLSGERGLGLTEGNVDCSDPAAFWMRGAHWSFGDVLISDLSFSPIRVSPLDDRESGNPRIEEDTVTVAFLLVGHFTAHAPDRSVPFSAGGAAQIANWWSIVGENDLPVRVLTLSLPRAELGSYGIDFRAPFCSLRPSTLVHDPLLPFLQTLLPIIEHTSIPTEPTATILVRLATGLFIAEEAQIEPANREMRRLRAQADELICRTFADPELTPATLAATLGLTPAGLAALFDDTGSGETVAATIELCRVTHAVELLGAPTDEPSPSMLATARQTGFEGITDLDRAVQTVYGTTAISMLAGFRRLNEADYPDEGGVQTFVSRLRQREPARQRVLGQSAARRIVD